MKAIGDDGTLIGNRCKTNLDPTPNTILLILIHNFFTKLL